MESQFKYQPFANFVMRSPLLPLNKLLETIDSMDKKTVTLKDVLKDASIMEALFLGSPVLHQEVTKYIEGGLTDKKEVNRLEDSVLRYFMRMSSRCTPFGLFAGCSVGEIQDDISIVLDDISRYGRNTRLDMNYLCALSLYIAQLPEVKPHTRFYPNSSLYEFGNQLRYVEYKYMNANRIHSIVSVDNSDYLQTIIQAASSGAKINELVPLLVDDEISTEESAEFIDELIESQVLISELEPAITGKEYFEQLSEILSSIPGIEDLYSKLMNIDRLLTAIDNGKIGETYPLYQQIIEIVKDLGVDYDLKYLFQADMTKPAKQMTVSQQLMDDIHDGLIMFNKLSLKHNFPTLMSRFAESFYERYEGQSVQLLKVLDTEIGIGYRNSGGFEGDINPLVDDLGFAQQGSNSSEIHWDGVTSFLHKKYLEARIENKYEIQLKDEDFKEMPVDWSDLPPTMSVMCELFSYNDDQKMVYLHSAGGSSAANLLGRFCHKNPELLSHVLKITTKEEELSQDVIYAEIVHLPESRIGNILLRPVLRKYEIPYLAKAGVESEYQLPLSDLYVSVVGNTVMLHSKKLQKRIIPRMSTAHNYSFGAMPVYQFLCDLQTQGLRGGIGFNWGGASDEYEFLPRVSYKNMIFSFARWLVKMLDFKVIAETKDEGEQLQKIAEWREKNKIPRFVTMPDGDNELFVDLTSPVSIRTLYSVVKKRPYFQLNEFPFDVNSANVKDGMNNVYSNEFVFAFYRSSIENQEKK